MIEDDLTITNTLLPIMHKSFGNVAVVAEKGKVEISFTAPKNDKSGEQFSTITTFVKLAKGQNSIEMAKRIYTYIRNRIKSAEAMNLPGAEIQLSIIEELANDDYLTPLKEFRVLDSRYFPMLGTIAIEYEESDPELAIITYIPANHNIRTSLDRANRFYSSVSYIRKAEDLSLEQTVQKVIAYLEECIKTCDVDSKSRGLSIQNIVSEGVRRRAHLNMEG